MLPRTALASPSPRPVAAVDLLSHLLEVLGAIGPPSPEDRVAESFLDVEMFCDREYPKLFPSANNFAPVCPVHPSTLRLRNARGPVTSEHPDTIAVMYTQATSCTDP